MDIFQKKPVSVMSLGTVQFGMDYGIANLAGQPTEDGCHKMLDKAFGLGVNSIDTAAKYGNSEIVIGNYFKQYPGVAESIVLTTKLVSDLDNTASFEMLEKEMISKMEMSLERLGLKKISNLLLHNMIDIYRFGFKIEKALKSLVKRGYVDNIGASVYTTKDIEEVLKYDDYNVIQIPVNVFDQRIIRTGLLDKLHKKGYFIFVRSVFAQGLFFLDPNTIEDPMLEIHAKKHLQKLKNMCDTKSISIAEYAVSFIRSFSAVDSLVLGADTPEQIEQNWKLFNLPVLSEEELKEVSNAFKDIDFDQILNILSQSESN